MVKIFYSYSNYSDDSKSLFNKLCNYFNKNNEIITDVDNNKDKLLLNNIIKHIESSDIFICDISIENKDGNDRYTFNPNVMYELGFAYNYFNEDNMLILLNTTVSNNRPSLLEGIKYEEYKNEDMYFETIKERIKYMIDKVTLYNKWETVIYILPDIILKYIKNVFNINIIGYNIKINPENNKIIIFFNTDNKQSVRINIITKKLYIDNKEIYLYDYKEIYKELKHIEIIANSNWFKQIS
jgi:hypothetical protein